MAASMRAITFCRSTAKVPLSSCFLRCLFVQSCQTQEATAAQPSRKEIQIPKRKKRDPTAVLQALSRTVKRDSTAAPYIYHDDPYLLPKNAGEKRRYALASESGKQAAQYVINKWPQNFMALQHDEPKVEAFYPLQNQYLFNEPSEEAILERVEAADMKAALEMFYNTLEAGSEVSMETSNALLDLLCFHGYNAEPEKVTESEETPENEVIEEEKPESAPIPDQSDSKGKRPWSKRAGREPKWKENNDTEKYFNAMPDRNSHSYCSMVRGMIKHGAASSAFVLYNEMQERGVQADVHSYNALIKGAVYIRDDYQERWTVILQLMQQMQLEGISPNLQTFNSLLDSLRIMGVIGRRKALQTLSEMKAVGVEPSLGTYNLLLVIFYKDSLPPSDMLYDIMDTIEGMSFSLKHDQDVHFFKNAMNVCLNLKDVELAYRVDLLLNTGDNNKLAGDYFSQSIYYSKFFNLICLMDSVDAMFEYYDQIVPSALVPNSQIYVEMLRSMETAGAYTKVHKLWKDIEYFGHKFHQPLIECLLSVMAQANDLTEKVSSEFLEIALEIRTIVKTSKSRKYPVRWNSRSLTHLAMVCLKCGQLQHAWDVMDLFQQENLVPSNVLLEDYVEACVVARDSKKAIDCLQLVSNVSTTLTLQITDRIKGEFTLHPLERKRIDDIVSEDDAAIKGSS
ncbi:pentatricopeptide repeat domain-containing protein 3, mitochondrial-like [Asterias rubens]|uniref:pentatricopeptide repeat domain-containing protein 3, mitochondrial-like n=1 Tax=Asterias rubens TaxID=7604 RepID=UPI001455B272|nr:pentatricopeptide repeat domain-containing protein 3, mitochondrial-like [Asterias rubens]